MCARLLHILFISPELHSLIFCEPCVVGQVPSPSLINNFQFYSTLRPDNTAAADNTTAAAVRGVPPSSDSLIVYRNNISLRRRLVSSPLLLLSSSDPRRHISLYCHTRTHAHRPHCTYNLSELYGFSLRHRTRTHTHIYISPSSCRVYYYRTDRQRRVCQPNDITVLITMCVCVCAYRSKK